MNHFCIQISLSVIFFIIFAFFPMHATSEMKVSIKNYMQKDLYIKGTGEFDSIFHIARPQTDADISYSESTKWVKIRCCWQAVERSKRLMTKGKKFFMGGEFVVFDEQLKMHCHDGLCLWGATEDFLQLPRPSGNDVVEPTQVKYTWRKVEVKNGKEKCEDMVSNPNHELFNLI